MDGLALRANNEPTNETETGGADHVRHHAIDVAVGNSRTYRSLASVLFAVAAVAAVFLGLAGMHSMMATAMPATAATAMPATALPLSGAPRAAPHGTVAMASVPVTGLDSAPAGAANPCLLASGATCLASGMACGLATTAVIAGFLLILPHRRRKLFATAARALAILAPLLPAPRPPSLTQLSISRI